MSLGNPLGNPLGLEKHAGAVAGKYQGPGLVVITIPGPGEFYIPAGATNYRIVAVGAGAAGGPTYGGGSGAVAIKQGVIDRPDFRIRWVIGNGGYPVSPDGEATTVSFADSILTAGGGIVTQNATASATGGDSNISGMIRRNNIGDGNSSTTPGAGSGNSSGNYNGGGAGYAGGSGGKGLNSGYSGASSIAPIGVAETASNLSFSTATVTIYSGENYTSGSKSGDGGAGGGGGGRGDSAGFGGVGMVRIEWWKQ